MLIIPIHSERICMSNNKCNREELSAHQNKVCVFPWLADERIFGIRLHTTSIFRSRKVSEASSCLKLCVLYLLLLLQHVLCNKKVTNNLNIFFFYTDLEKSRNLYPVLEFFLDLIKHFNQSLIWTTANEKPEESKYHPSK